MSNHKMANVCDICDQYPKVTRVLPPIFLDLGGKTQFHGPIRTIKCFEDNSKIRQLVATPGHGAVLVIDGGASLRRALVGGTLASSAGENNWAGMVVYGAVRDSVELKMASLGLRALGIFPIRTHKKDVGEIDIPIEVGGINILPGEYIYADGDGIVVCSAPVEELSLSQ